jgi:tRNA 2-selenouridine synthase
MKSNGIAKIQQLDQFEDIIDVRSPSEYAEDHIPGAINCPVLSDEERIQIGTMYKQVSPFEAKKLGAAYIAKRIAQHIETLFIGKPKEWKPLIYCWRGGKRSGSMTYILRQIGWNAHILDGGYKSYRRDVVSQLNTLSPQFQYQVITGMTGSGKSKVLERLSELGTQVLDLESLAQHKGSVLGNLPESLQPSQKMFETLLLLELQKFDPNQKVFVEAESRKIGCLHVPDALLNSMRQSPCSKIEATIDARVAFLIDDYPYFIEQPDNLIHTIGFLKELHGKEKLDHWRDLVLQKEWKQLVRELLEQHYDALYKRSQNSNYVNYEKAPCYTTADLSTKGIDILAHQLMMEHHHA